MQGKIQTSYVTEENGNLYGIPYQSAWFKPHLLRTQVPANAILGGSGEWLSG